MANLKSIRKRIGTVKSTQKITRAMKMVAGARLNRAQQRILALRPYAVKTADETRVVRHGKRVDAYMLAVRTHFTPDIIRVAAGDTVYFHVTNLEQDIDITHGFGILGSNLDMQVDPGETKTVRWVAEKPGITPFYCSNFCSALHQEMQGYIEVSPSGTRIADVTRPSQKQIEDVTAAIGR